MTALVDRAIAEELDGLALLHLHDEADPHTIHQHVDRIADPALTPEQTWAAFEDLVEAVRLREGISTGELHWTDVDGTLTCPNPSEAAHEIACERVDDAMRRLIGGAR